MAHDPESPLHTPLFRADVPPYVARQWVTVGCASSPFFAVALLAAYDEKILLLVLALVLAFLIIAVSGVLYCMEQKIKDMQNGIRDSKSKERQGCIKPR